MFKQYAKQFSFLVLSVVAAHPAWAQKDFRSGYIVQLGGDTLRGEVDVRGAQRMANSCLFRLNASAEPVKYLPTALKAYGLRQGERYEALQVPQGLVLQNAPAPPPPPVLFMQVLTQGKASLYAFVDDEDQGRYCFRQEGKPLIELTEIKKTVEIRGKRMLVHDFPFRQVLASAFADCSAVQPLLAKAELADSRLLNIFHLYNRCGGEDLGVARPAPRTSKLQVGLVAGIQSSSGLASDRGEYFAVRSKLRPLFGVGLLLKPAAFNSKVAIRIEAYYQKQLLEGGFTFSNALNGLSTNREVTADLAMLRIPVMLRYTWPTGKARPYIQAGPELGILLAGQAQIRSEEEIVTYRPSETYTHDIGLNKRYIGPTAGLGLLVPVSALGAVQLEARVNQQWGSVSQKLGIITGPVTLTFLLGYTFGQ